MCASSSLVEIDTEIAASRETRCSKRERAGQTIHVRDEQLLVLREFLRILVVAKDKFESRKHFNAY